MQTTTTGSDFHTTRPMPTVPSGDGQMETKQLVCHFVRHMGNVLISILFDYVFSRVVVTESLSIRFTLQSSFNVGIYVGPKSFNQMESRLQDQNPCLS